MLSRSDLARYAKPRKPEPSLRVDVTQGYNKVADTMEARDAAIFQIEKLREYLANVQAVIKERPESLLEIAHGLGKANSMVLPDRTYLMAVKKVIRGAEGVCYRYAAGEKRG